MRLPRFISAWRDRWVSASLTTSERRFICSILLVLVFGLALRAYYRLVPPTEAAAPAGAGAASATPPLEAARPSGSGTTPMQPLPADARGRIDADVGELLVEELVR
ncbi:MAG: hypothetical protein IJT88_08905 [Kiritimatiellae bacterium]|nr:hypothetical protein [Kiritimatiellia bacterium]